MDYLDSKADPRNLLETYKRVTVSSRYNKQWNSNMRQYHFGVNLDYSGSFDDDDIDPELNYGGVDKYKSDYSRYAIDLSLDMDNKKERSLFKSWNLLFSTAYERDVIERTRLVQLDRAGGHFQVRR